MVEEVLSTSSEDETGENNEEELKSQVESGCMK